MEEYLSITREFVPVVAYCKSASRPTMLLGSGQIQLVHRRNYIPILLSIDQGGIDIQRVGSSLLKLETSTLWIICQLVDS